VLLLLLEAEEAAEDESDIATERSATTFGEGVSGLRRGVSGV